MARKVYPSDVTDDERAFASPYVALMTEEAPQRTYDLQEVFNGPRWIIQASTPWRMTPNDLPRGKLNAGIFAASMHDLRFCCG